MVEKQPAGFTLIEIVIVLAISSMLAVMALVGFSQTRGQAQFSDSVEQLKEQLLAIRTEANSTIKLAGGSDDTQITLGRLVTFTPGSSDVTVQTLVTANNDAPAAGQAVTVNAAETRMYQMRWGLVFSPLPAGGPRQMAFIRSPTDGSLRAVTGTWTAPYTYGNFAAAVGLQQFRMTDPDGRQAWVEVDKSNAGITRRYQ